MLRRPYRALLRAANAVTYGLLPASTWASQITLGSTISQIPALAWATVFCLSSVAGLSSLLNKLKTETPPKLGVFVASHMLGSWLAGVLAFFGLEAWGISDFTEPALIALAGYAGARLIDGASAALINRVSNQIQGTPNVPPIAQKPEQQ